MKKIITLALALMMVFALAACGNSGSVNNPSNTTDPGTSQQPSTPDSTDSSGTSGNDEGKIITGGETGAAAPSAVTLPNNVKIEISANGNAGKKTIKIGNDYYAQDIYGEQTFYKSTAENEWKAYHLSNGTWVSDGSSSYEDIMENCFTTINSYISLGVEPVTTGRSMTIAGVAVKEYKYVLHDTDLFCWLSADGISFNHNDVFIITAWDTSVTSFGFDTP